MTLSVQIDEDRADALKELAEKAKAKGQAYVLQVSPDSILSLISALEEARAKIKKYEARLEIDHYFVLDPKAPDGTRRVDAPMEFPDGIECRDATIQLLEERIAELTSPTGKPSNHDTGK
jgi:glutamyl/glutaminyl-tRNA synthetase